MYIVFMTISNYALNQCYMQLHPDWRLREQFLVNENHPALSADAGLASGALSSFGSADVDGWAEKLKGIECV